MQGLVRLMTASEPTLRRSGPGRPPWGPGGRGYQLLIDNLSRAQRDQYLTYRYFDVVGGDTGKRYRIRHGYQMNVEELDQKGRRRRLLCFLPAARLPVGDVMLAQKIALELFELDALQVAHHSPVWDDVSAWEARFPRGSARR